MFLREIFPASGESLRASGGFPHDVMNYKLRIVWIKIACKCTKVFYIAVIFQLFFLFFFPMDRYLHRRGNYVTFVPVINKRTSDGTLS
jgi:hypothetical protein